MKVASVMTTRVVMLKRLVNSLRSELEAERQRADEYLDCILVLADQLSVNALPKEVIEAVAALKSRLANPVVLPPVDIAQCGCILCGEKHPTGLPCPMLRVTADKGGE